MDTAAGNLTVKSVWFSPASVIVYVENLPEENRVLEDFDIVMRDGSSPEIRKYQIVGDVPDGNTTPIYGLFPQIINPADVRSIVVNGVEICVDQGSTP